MKRDRDLFGPLVRSHVRMSFRGRASQAFSGQLAGRPTGIAWLFVMYVAIGAATLPAAVGGADVFTYALLTQLLTWTMCGLSLTAEAGLVLVLDERLVATLDGRRVLDRLITELADADVRV